MTNANDPWGTPALTAYDDARNSFDNPPKSSDVQAVQASSNDEVVVTFKAGAGYDAPWIVVHAKDLRDALDQVSGENRDVLKELMTEVAGAGKFFSSLGGGKPSSGGGSSQRPNTAPPAGASEGPGPAPHCDHGAMVWRSGISQKGNAYKLWSCTGPRGSQCDPVYPK